MAADVQPPEGLREDLAESIRWEHPDAHRPYWNPDDSLTHEPRRGPVDLDAFGSPVVIAPPPEGQERSEEQRHG